MKPSHTSPPFHCLCLTRLIIIPILVFLSIESHSQKPKTPEEAFAKGQTALENRKWDECIYYFQIARDLYTTARVNNYALSNFNCGYCAMQSANMLDGIPYFEEIIRVSPQLSLKAHYFQVHHGAYLNLAYIYSIDKQYEQSNQVIEELFSVLETDTSDHTLHNFLAGQGRLIYNTFQINNYDKAEEEIRKAESIIDTISLADKTDGFIKNLSNIYGSIGDYYGRIGRYTAFKNYMQLQYEVLEERLGKNDRRLSWPLTGLGNYYYRYGYYHEALDYYKRALLLIEVDKDTESDASYRYAYIQNDIAEIYDHLEDFEKALEHISEAVEVYEKQEHLILDYYESSALKGKIHAIIGDTLMAKKQIAIATQVYQTHSERTTFIHDILLRVVATQETLGNLTEAIDHAQYMLQLGKEIFPERSFEVAQDYNSLAQLHYTLGDFETAMLYIDSARTANLTIDEEIILPTIQTSIESLEIKILNKTEGKSEQYLVAKIKKGSQYIKRIKSQIENEINPTYQPTAFYDNAIDLSYSLYTKTGNEEYIKLAFEMSEQSRSFDLKNFIKKSEALEQAMIDNDLMQRKKKILDDVNTVRFLMDEPGDQLDERLKLKNQYDSLTQEYQRVIKEIEDTNPAYYAFKYDTSAIDLNKLEQRLTDSNTKMISYYVSQKNLYRIEIGQNGWAMAMKPWDDTREQEVMNLRAIISSPEQINDFEMHSKNLHDYLLDTIKSSNLLIIPDHVLNYIPFELLTFQNGDYLLEKSLVRYAYSAETYLHKRNQSSGSKQLLAMAPEFKNGTATEDPVRSAISALPFASEEAQNISKVMQGDYILGFDATETAFRTRSSLYSTLHLSTHAIVDDYDPSRSRLIFSLEGDSIHDGYLHAFEIYNLDLNAQLVTLSACNTGFGTIKKGEGVMSLSRAFAYAGVPATVVSLWPASDRSTSELMNFFYQYLNEGQTKDEALNNARVQYLKNAQGKARHPFYWGGFVLIGDNSPLDDGKNPLVWIIPVVIILSLILTLYRRKNTIT